MPNAHSNIEHLLGNWSYNPHPSSLDHLVICEDGRGLIMYGNPGEGSPYVDEFTWEVIGEGLLSITWLVRHGCDADDEDNPERCQFAIDVLTSEVTHVPFALPTKDEETGTSETKHYFFCLQPEKYMLMDLGFHWHISFDDYIDDPWTFCGPAKSFEEERDGLHEYAEYIDIGNFLAGMNRHTETARKMEASVKRMKERMEAGGQAIVIHELPATEETKQSAVEQFSLFGANPVLKLLMISGTLGMVALFSEYPHRAVLPRWLSFVILLAPVALMFLCWQPEEFGDRLRILARRLLLTGAFWYLALVLLAGIGVATGLTPIGWQLYLLFIGCGIVPAVHALRKKS